MELGVGIGTKTVWVIGSMVMTTTLGSRIVVFWCAGFETGASVGRGARVSVLEVEERVDVSMLELAGIEEACVVERLELARDEDAGAEEACVELFGELPVEEVLTELSGSSVSHEEGRIGRRWSGILDIVGCTPPKNLKVGVVEEADFEDEKYDELEVEVATVSYSFSSSN